MRAGGIPIRDARGAAQEHEGRALARLARGVEIGADDHVGEAVSVDVPGARDRVTQLRAALVRLQLCVRGGGIPIRDARGAAQEHEGRALTEALTRVVGIRADDHVGESVAVDVPGARDRVAQVRLDLVRFELRVRGGGVAIRDARGAAQEHEGRALLPLTRFVEIGADDHVVVAVAVDVPSARDGEAQVRAALVRLQLCVRGGGIPDRKSVV